MSKAHRCDICGAFFDPYYGRELPYYRFIQSETPECENQYVKKHKATNQLYFVKDNYRGDHSIIQQELCPDCIQSFEGWLLERQALRNDNFPKHDTDTPTEETEERTDDAN